MRMPPQFTIDSGRETVLGIVAFTTRVPQAIQCWTAHVARDVLRLGVYLYAAAVWYRIPGAEDYRGQAYDDLQPDAPGSADDPMTRLKGADRRTVLALLAECLRRLQAEWVLKDVPGGRTFKPSRLKHKWIAYLDRVEAFDGGLLSVAAQCLDRLIVYPGLEETNHVSPSTWWQKWWTRLDG
jgi:hypothetical protein